MAERAAAEAELLAELEQKAEAGRKAARARAKAEAWWGKTDELAQVRTDAL